VLSFLSIIVPLLIAVAYLTLAERKLMGSIQQRKGPNVVGFLGALQPIADGLKLLIKETIVPMNADIVGFMISPIITLLLSLFGWSIIPFNDQAVFSNINIGVLFLFAVSSLGVYGILLSG